MFVVTARRIDHPAPFEVVRTDNGVSANELAAALSALPHIASVTVTLA